MKTLGLSFAFLTGAGAVGAAEGTLPARPIERRDVGVAPPTRIPKLETPPMSGTPTITADVPQTVRRAVVADAAKRFNVAESAVVVAHAEQITWSDGSLGCPEPGVYYTQNLVPGYLIVAKTPMGEDVYHTDSRGQAKRCGNWRPQSSAKPPEKMDR